MQKQNLRRCETKYKAMKIDYFCGMIDRTKCVESYFHPGLLRLQVFTIANLQHGNCAEPKHCVKRVHIRSYFGPNARKYRPE